MFQQGSILEFNWFDGDVIFANSTCFDDALMLKMSAMAENLKPGAIFVTFTKGLVSKGTYKYSTKENDR